jgi:hypothetical protein
MQDRNIDTTVFQNYVQHNKLMKEYYFTALQIELGVVVIKTENAESNVTRITTVHRPFPLLRFWQTMYHPCGLASFSEDGRLCTKCFSVRRGSVLSENAGLALSVLAH